MSAILKKGGMDSAVDRQSREKSNSPNSTKDSALPIAISISDIICEHGLLDPQKSKDMKRISRVCTPQNRLLFEVGADA